MSDKPLSASSVRDKLALLLITGGVMLLITTPRHSFLHGISDPIVFAGFALFWFGSYRFVPAVLVLTGGLIGLGPKTWEAPSVVVMALGLVVGIYGWWKDRQGKALAER